MVTATAAPSAAPSAAKGLRIDIQIPHDGVAKRDSLMRVVSLIGFSTIALLVPVFFGTLWGSFLGIPKVGLLAGLGGAIVLLIPLVTRSLVSNPEWTGFVTLNPLNGHNIPYGPGLHASYFWEQRNKNGNYSLRVVTKTFEMAVQTKTSQIIVSGIFEYQRDLARLVNNIGIDETTVNAGYTGFIDNFLTSNLAEKTAEEARVQVEEVNGLLADQFMGAPSADGTNLVDFEAQNGLRTVTVAITGLRLPADVQKTRDAVDEGTKVFEIMASLKGVSVKQLKKLIKDGKLTKKEEAELRRAALATSGNAEMKIFEGSQSNLGAFGDVVGGANKKTN
jgi:hypothetical protein